MAIKPLRQLAAAGIDNRKTKTPQRIAHDAEAHQPGHEEVDVSGSRFAHHRVTGRHRIAAPGATLDGVISEHARRASLGIRVVVAEHNAGPITGLNDQRDLSGAQQLFCRRRIGFGDIESRRLAGGAGKLRPGNSNLEHVRGPAAECDTEPGGNQDGEEQRPEHSLWLAREFAHPNQRQLDEGPIGERAWPLAGGRSVLTHRAGDGQ